MTLSGVLAKNTTYLTISSLAQKLLAFWWFAYVAHQLAEGDLFGKYTFALQFTSIFVILMNFGLIPVLIREGAKQPDQLQTKFSQALSLKIVLTIISVLALLAVFYSLNYYNPRPADTVQLVYLAIGIIVFDTFRSIIFAVLRAQQQMQYEAIGQFFYQIAVIIIGISFFALGMKAAGLIMAINLASMLFLIYSIYILYTKSSIRLRWLWDRALLWKLLLIATPFALADVFFKLNGSLDTVMLGYLAGERYVAWYGIALKLTITLTVIPGAFATAFFPAMSQAIHKSAEVMRDIFEQFSIMLLVLSLPLTVGSIVLAPRIIGIAFKDFPAATPALQLLMISLVFLFANYPIGNALNAANQQVLNTVNMGIALVTNIILNVLLISPYDYIGAAIAAVISTIVLVGLGLPHVYQLTHFRWLVIGRKAVLIGLASAVMGVVLWWLQIVLPDTKAMFAVIAASGIGAYAAACLLLRAIRLSELRTVWQQLRGRS